jgi:hypothetical protein
MYSNVYIRNIMEFTMENITIESINKIRSVSPHPMKRDIRWWREYIQDCIDLEEDWSFDTIIFSRFFFSSGRNKIKKINEFIHNNDFWIKMSELSNEDAVKLKHRAYLDKKRMHSKLKELDIKLYEVSIRTHIRKTSAPVNFSRVYYKGTEIIY